MGNVDQIKPNLGERIGHVALYCLALVGDIALFAALNASVFTPLGLPTIVYRFIGAGLVLAVNFSFSRLFSGATRERVWFCGMVAAGTMVAIWLFVFFYPWFLRDAQNILTYKASEAETMLCGLMGLVFGVCVAWEGPTLVFSPSSLPHKAERILGDGPVEVSETVDPNRAVREKPIVDSPAQSSAKIPERFVTTESMESESLAPLQLSNRSGRSPSESLTVAMGQVEAYLRTHVASPPKVTLVRLKTGSQRTLLSEDVASSTAEKFYSIALVCAGKNDQVVSVLRINQMGAMATVAIDVQQDTPLTQGMGKRMFTSVFAPKEDDGKEDKRFLGTCLIMLAGAGIGGAIGGGIGMVVGIVVVGAVVTSIAASLKNARGRELEDLKTLAKVSMLHAYNSIDLDGPAPRQPRTEGRETTPKASSTSEATKNAPSTKRRRIE